MTPDDWREAMRHEADAAPDPVWAAKTRRAARHLRWGRWLLGHLVLGQTALVALALLLTAPAGLGPWLALAAAALSLRALRFGAEGHALLGLAFAWAALASAPGAEELFGVALPPALPLLGLAGLGILVLWPGARRKMAP